MELIKERKSWTRSERPVHKQRAFLPLEKSPSGYPQCSENQISVSRSTPSMHPKLYYHVLKTPFSLTREGECSIYAATTVQPSVVISNLKSGDIPQLLEAIFNVEFRNTHFMQRLLIWFYESSVHFCITPTKARGWRPSKILKLQKF